MTRPATGFADTLSPADPRAYEAAQRDRERIDADTLAAVRVLVTRGGIPELEARGLLGLDPTEPAQRSGREVSGWQRQRQANLPDPSTPT